MFRTIVIRGVNKTLNTPSFPYFRVGELTSELAVKSANNEMIVSSEEGPGITKSDWLKSQVS